MCKGPFSVVGGSGRLTTKLILVFPFSAQVFDISYLTKLVNECAKNANSVTCGLTRTKTRSFLRNKLFLVHVCKLCKSWKFRINFKTTPDLTYIVHANSIATEFWHTFSNLNDFKFWLLTRSQNFSRSTATIWPSKLVIIY